MTRTMILALCGVLLIAVGARGSDPVGIYAVIDRVVMEPKEGTPERIQVWGVFVLASKGGAEHTARSAGTCISPPRRARKKFAAGSGPT
jgi:hypothetical protein